MRREPAPWSGRIDRAPQRRPFAWRTLAMPLGALVVALGVAAALSVVMSRPGRGPAPPPEPSAAEAVRQRFPAEWTATASTDMPAAGPALRTDFADRFGGPAPPAETAAVPPGGGITAYAPAPAWPTPAPPAETARPRPSNALLNDAQIASIKGRLKLTAEQEKLWPPVEAALRGVVWRRSADRRGTAVLDAPSIERLKAAAGPLMGRLREDQKREVRSLSHVMGLGDIAEKL